MKKLIIIRHAKSSWKYDVIDHERPLNSRGLVDCELIADSISDIKSVDLVLVSDAFRTKKTSEIILKESNLKYSEIEYLHELYDFSGENLTHIIKNCDNNVNDLMVFGHNYAITSFVNTYGSEFVENVPTCGVTIIEFDIDKWEDLENGRTTKTIYPKELK